jgi:hypothetical protein
MNIQRSFSEAFMDVYQNRRQVPESVFEETGITGLDEGTFIDVGVTFFPRAGSPGGYVGRAVQWGKSKKQDRPLVGDAIKVRPGQLIKLRERPPLFLSNSVPYPNLELVRGLGGEELFHVHLRRRQSAIRSPFSGKDRR